MRKAIQTEYAIKAHQYLISNGYKADIDWDKPTPECFAIFQVLLDVNLLVDQRGQRCKVVNQYGPNPHGLTDPKQINSKYGY